jgi:hypothetical protein
MHSFTYLQTIIATALPLATVIGSVRNSIRIPTPHVLYIIAFLYMYSNHYFFLDLCEYDSCFIFTTTLLSTLQFKLKIYGTKYVRPTFLQGFF